VQTDCHRARLGPSQVARFGPALPDSDQLQRRGHSHALTNRQTRKFLNPKEASDIGPFKEAYAPYAQYSGNAAHPTLTALARHWSPLDEKTAAFDAIPEPTEDQLDETLHLACIALLSIMVVVNEMNGFTEAGRKSIELNIELKTLQAERWGGGEIGGDGMESEHKNSIASSAAANSSRMPPSRPRASAPTRAF
jgi:hypothetical protein